MSEQSKRIGCVIVAHGRLGQCLMEAVQGIVGTQQCWVAVSNTDLGLSELRQSVDRAIDGLSPTHDVILLSDMPGGSCHHACREIVAERPELRLLSGLNLMMLLEFFVKRERHGLDELLGLVQERGRDSVRTQ